MNRGSFAAGTWTPYSPQNQNQDDVWSWLGQPYSWSVTGADVLGETLTMSHRGGSDNADVGFCYCYAHGGFEIGGGLLHSGSIHVDSSIPIDGDKRSQEAVRRIRFGNWMRRYEAESGALSHVNGRADGDGWSANVTQDQPGHMIFGPYATDWGVGDKRAVFRAMVDVITGVGDVFAIDIYDVTAQQIIAHRQVSRSEFSQPHTHQNIVLDFNLDGRANHTLEARLWWHDISYVKVDYVEIRNR